MTELFFSLLILSLGIAGFFRLTRFLRKLLAYLTAKSGQPALNPLSKIPLLSWVLIPFLTLLVISLTLVYSHLVQAAGTLSVEIMAGYNLVVDSNVTSPSTFGPSAATVAGKICNTGNAPITNVTIYIGDTTKQTPGLYPRRYVTDTNFLVQHPALNNPGSYAFTHEGGSVGLSDATRQAGVLQPGQCTVQYWTFSYPRCENKLDGTADTPQCDYDAVWGNSVKPDDDLWLTFDVWAKGFDGTTTITTSNSWKMYMRNEISAMANKIQPNGNPGGLWFNTDPSTIRPGGVITTNGILYRIGNVNFGFDNNNDYLPDTNFWVQPIGNPGGFDPGCFRLIKTSGIIIVAGGTPKVFTFTDQLYFTRPQIPDDNTNVTGEVYYTYVAIGSNCAVTPSPYQEAASGYDNEKFNADYGSGGPPPVSIPQALVTINKSGNPDLINVGAVITYSMPFVNQSATESAGLTFYSGAYVNNPLVISDTVPSGTQYITGTATYTLGFSPNTGVKIFYSTDNGQSWSEVEPIPASGVTNIQWWLQDPLPPTKSGSASFVVRVPATYTGGPVIENCANAQFGTGPSIGKACDSTLVQGNNSVGDFVWRDENANSIQDAGESPLSNISVSLYWDKNGDGKLDSSDLLVLTTTTGVITTGNYTFTNLADGKYLVTVDTKDADLPYGYSLTTQKVFAIDLDSAGTNAQPVTYTQADFGFGPSLGVNKSLATLPVYEGQNVVYTLEVKHLRTAPGQTCSAIQDFWATGGQTAGGSGWNTTAANAWQANELNGVFAQDAFGGGQDRLWANPITPTLPAGAVINSVSAVYYMYKTGAFADDTVTARVYSSTIETPSTGGNLGIRNQNISAAIPVGVGNANYMTLDVTSLEPTWETSDFPKYWVVLEANKSASADGVTVFADSLGWRVSYTYTCPSVPGGTINPVPVSDVYDASKLQFVSAQPPQSSLATGGSSPYANTGALTWSNVGPLDPGQTKIITLTFKTLQPSGNQTTTVTNTVTVSEATFLNGTSTNTGTKSVSTTLLPTSNIGDIVWRDQNGNQVQDAGEVGIPGVVISLTSDITLTYRNIIYPPNSTITTTTSLTGYYLFEGLYYTGRYTVSVATNTLPTGGSGFTVTYELTNTLDSVLNSRTTFPFIPTLAGGGDQLGADFGYQLPSIIDGTIWHDWNRSGTSTQDTGEEGLSGITITLSIGGSTYTTTDANGYYRFIGNFTGTYTVTVLSNTGSMSAGTWIQSFDSDGLTTPSQVSSSIVTGGYGRADYSYYQTGLLSLGDTVYVDWNGSGVQDSGEPGISNISISLYEDSNGDGVIDSLNDMLVMTTTTSLTGYYNFANLPSNRNFIVKVDENDTDWPSVLSVFNRTQDYDGLKDGQAKVALTTVSTNTVDFGYQPIGTGSIGDFVWQDSNRNRTPDSGEPGLPIITVKLYVDNNGDGLINPSIDSLVTTTSTNASGVYSFTYLPPATYLVQVDTADPDLPKDSYSNPYILTTLSNPISVTLSAGQNYTQADFGFISPGIIGDLIYQDNNGNGQWETGEPGIPGITVTLSISGSATPLYTTTTDAIGFYNFTGLTSNTYVVKVIAGSLPAGYIQTGDPEYPVLSGTTYLEICSDDSSAAFGGCDSQSTVSLRAGQIDLTRDFGYKPPRSIGDFVWLDNNGDGIQDPGEPGLSGITITLTTPDGGIFTTTTDINGYYGFGGMSLSADGTYTVSVITASLPTTYGTLTPTYDLNGLTTPHVATVTLSPTLVYTTVDFGYRYAGSYTITGTVFYDQGGSGDTLTDTFTAGDTPYVGIPVYLYRQGSSLPVGSTTTDASGRYTFTNLSAYTYTVSANSSVSTLANLSLTASPGGTITSTYSVRTSVIITNASVGSIDYGFYAPLPRLTKSVLPTGMVVAGDVLTYTIVLSNNQATPITGLTISDTVPANTSYVTNSLAITPLSGVGLAGATDNLPLIRISPITVAANSLVTITFQVTVDASLPLTVTAITNTALLTSTYAQTTSTVTNSANSTYIIGDSVWFDLNHNGIQDEVSGLDGITLTITYPNGTVATATTSATGAYSFTVPGNQAYTITVIPANFAPGGPLAAYTSTLSNQGGDNTLDSDGQPNGSGGVIFTTPVITQDNSTFDFGFYIPIEPTLSKAVSFTPGLTATLGTTVTYVITVPDPAISRTLTSVVVTDTLNTPLYPVMATVSGGLTPTVALNGQVMAATFGAITAGSQARITVTAIISDATITSGAIITNTAVMTHAQAGTLTTSNPVTTTLGEPSVMTVNKSVQSSSGSLTNLDGTALLTYTIRLTNTGSNPAYSVVITDAVPAGISVINYLGSYPWSGPVAGPALMRWTIDTISNTIPNNVVLLTYTAKISGAASGTGLTNLVTATYHSLTDTLTGVRTYGPVTGTTTVTPADPNVIKTVSPASSAASPLRIGDVISYTIVTQVPPGVYVPWPYQYDYLPAGLRYITGTFAVTTTLPFSGTSLTDTLTSPYVSRYEGGDRGVNGTTASFNPNIGAHYLATESDRQAIEWWLQPLNNRSAVTGLVTATFQAQLVGVDLLSTSVWTNPLIIFQPQNYGSMRWNLQDMGSYTYTVTTAADDSLPITTSVGQPNLTLDKHSLPVPGATVNPGDTITYTLTITNNGRAPAYDLVLTDTLPAGLTYQNTISNPGPGVIITPTRTGQLITYAINQLATAASMVITLTAQVDNPIPGGITLTNTASLPYYDSQPGSGSGLISPTQRTYSDGSDSVSHPAAIIPGLSLDPDHTATLQPGQVVTYTHVLTNEGNATDTFTLTMTSMGSFPTTNNIPPAITLTAGQTASFVITVTVPAGASATDQGVTVITATSTLSPSLSATDTDTTNTGIVPGLTLDPDHTQTLQPGQVVTYTHVLTNEGNAMDTFTLTVTSVGPFPTTSNIPPSITLTAGQTATFIITVTVPANATPTDQSVTVITATSGLSPALQAVDTDTTNVELADVAIVKFDDPDPVAAGGVLTYTLVYTNNGAATAQNVQITDTLPVGVNFGGMVSANPALPTPAGAGQTRVWTVGTLASGSSGSIVFTVTVNSNTSGIITNSVVITTSTPDSNLSNNNDDEPTEVGRPGLSITKTRISSSPVLIGQPVQFQIVVENIGNTDLPTVTLVDTYDTAYLAYTGATPVSDDNNNDGIITWANLGPIVAGGRVTVTVNFTATASTQALLNDVTINDARASGTDTNGTPVLPVTDTDTVGVINPGLVVDKSVNIARIAPHQIVTYTITITNVGDVPLNPVRVTDTLDTGLTFIPGTANPAPSTVNGQQLVWYDVMGGAGLAPGARTHITLRASVTTVPGSYGNLVVTTGGHSAGTTPPVSDTVSTHVEDPSIQVDKEVKTPGVVGELITFTIRITNTGPSTLDQVPLFDTFVGPVQYVGGIPLADTVDNANHRLTWNDLTTFFGDLAPGQSISLITVFRLTTTDSEFSMTNTARVSQADDVFNNVANEDEDTEVLTNVPTAVDLLYFTSHQAGDNVELHWATAVEYDNYGFRLLRSSTGSFADAIEIGFVSGQGQGTVSGTAYDFTDAGVEVHQTYTYWLVDVDFNGVETPHSETTSIGVAAGGTGTKIYLPLLFK